MNQNTIPMTFAGGPTYMPPHLKSALQEDTFANRTLLEVNSNTKQFKEVVEQARNHLRQIMDIPPHSTIWYLAGGCHAQFAGLPLNFIGNPPTLSANYTTTGYFSNMSFREAKRYCSAKSIISSTKNNKGQFELPSKYDFAENAAYTHFVDNQSVEGIQYPQDFFPVVPGIPLFDDCSSSFLSKSIDWSKVDMAYAHGQKNCGISGFTVMIANESLLKTNPNKILPELFSLQNYNKKNGYFAEMNILPIYSNLIMAKHISQNGGLHINNYQKRSNRLYEVLDKHKIYLPRVASKRIRSKVTVTWTTETQQIGQKCIEEGISNELYEFKGHRSIGGFRASLFCPIPDSSVYRLADFLQQFAHKYE